MGSSSSSSSSEDEAPLLPKPRYPVRIFVGGGEVENRAVM